MSSAAQIVALDPSTDPRWDAFVREHPRANAYHLGAWADILRASYGYRPHYLAAQEPGTGRLRGVLPLLGVSRKLSGPRLSSMPVAWTAGPLGDDREVERALVAEANRLASAQSAGRLLIRSSAGGLGEGAPGIRTEAYAPMWVLDLPPTVEALQDRWRADKHLWRNLRKADRGGLTVRQGGSQADIDAFYALYLRTMRRLRSLPRRRRQLLLTREALGDAFRLFLVESSGEAIAGAVLYAFGEALELAYSASDDRRLDLRPNHLLYRESIGWALQHGFARYDFGGAQEGTGLADFKRQWGAQPRAIHTYGWRRGGDQPLAERHEVPARGVLPALWSRAPLGVIELAGTVAYRWL